MTCTVKVDLFSESKIEYSTIKTSVIFHRHIISDFFVFDSVLKFLTVYLKSLLLVQDLLLVIRNLRMLKNLAKNAKI